VLTKCGKYSRLQNAENASAQKMPESISCRENKTIGEKVGRKFFVRPYCE
jgi:hypothetical protein